LPNSEDSIQSETANTPRKQPCHVSRNISESCMPDIEAADWHVKFTLRNKVSSHTNCCDQGHDKMDIQ
jgi:hypothetical protein